MTRWIGLALAVGIAAGLPCAADAQNVAKPNASRHVRQHDGARRYVSYEPHYYARPVYYRPYPYGVPAPFVFGYGPWW